MPKAPLSFFKQCIERVGKDQIKNIPNNTRGIYVLLNQNANDFNVVYIGMARGERTGVKSRLTAHQNSKKKEGKWTHFSLFEVHDNIPSEQVEELEGLLRHIFRKDARAKEVMNKQNSFNKLIRIRKKGFDDWK